MLNYSVMTDNGGTEKGSEEVGGGGDLLIILQSFIQACHQA